MKARIALALALVGGPLVGWYIAYVFFAKATNPQL